MALIVPVTGYRHTFLSRYIQNELDGRGDEDGRREEILALANLRYRLEQAFTEADGDLGEGVAVRIKAAVTTANFFYGDSGPEGAARRLYLQVPVVPLGEPGAPASAARWPELTGLLRDQTVRPRGVVLRARSGAGKTVAMLKSFHDCVFPREGPLLGGFLPCYLRDLTTASPPIRRRLAPEDESAAGESAGPESLIEELILQAAGFPKAPTKLVREWLKRSKPLLLFLDLNTVSVEVAELLSRALPHFQRRYNGQGHRCVAAYRSFGQDKVSSNLHNSQEFAFYDLAPLPQTDACRYLENLSRSEKRLRDTLGEQTGRLPRGTVPELDFLLLDRLIRQHVRGDSVLSTPLLTHLFSLLRSERQARVRCLAELYQEVVEEHLDRELGPLRHRSRLIDAPRAETPHRFLVEDSDFTTPEGRVRLKTALVRVALAILEPGSPQRSGALRLRGKGAAPPESVLQELLRNPSGKQPPWLSAALTLWRGADYWAARYPQDEIQDIQRLSLLRLDGGAYGFLHDSFLYYFAALSLRCPSTPLPDLCPIATDGPDPWYDQACSWLHLDPAAWRLPAEFLGGMLSSAQLLELVGRMLLLGPKAGWPDVLEALVQGRADRAEPVLLGIENALHHKAGRLSGFPQALRSEVSHYLRDATGEPACLDWIAPRFAARGGAAWLRSRRPTSWPLPSLQDHQGAIRCVALLPDGRVAAGGEDGRVVIWSPETGAVLPLAPHHGPVVALAVSRNGRVIVSGGEDGEVIVSNGDESRPLRLHEPGRAPRPVHNRGVVAVAVNEDGSVVLSAGEDGSVRRAREGRVELKPLASHPGGASGLAASAAGDLVYSGGMRGTLQRYAGGESTTLPTPGWSVRFLRTSADGLIAVFAAGAKVWPATPMRAKKSLLDHDQQVRAVELSDDGGLLVSAGRDGRVKARWLRMQPLPAPQDVAAHQGEALAAAVSADGSVVVSGGEDGLVKRLERGQAEAQTVLTHDGPVTAVAISADGRVVVSGGKDRTVRRAVAGARTDSRRNPTHAGRVTAVAVSADGRVIVSGGEDGLVKRLERGQAEAQTVLTHDGPVTAVAVSADGRVVVSGGKDRTVRRVRVGEKPGAPIYRHTRRVTALAVSGDGGLLVSGSEDGLIRRATESGPLPALEHGDIILALAATADGRLVLSGGLDGVVRSVVAGELERRPLLLHRADRVLAIAVSDDSGTAASAGRNSLLLHPAPESPGPAWAPLPRGAVLALRMNGPTVQAARAASNHIDLWSTAGAPCVGWLTSAAIRCLAWAAAAPLLVAGLANGEVIELELID